MGCCDAPGLMPLDEAEAMIYRQLHAIRETETQALPTALDRILAEDIHAPIDVPGYDNSAMDGYALRSADLNQFPTFKQVGKSFAGHAFDGDVGRGQCVRIMTGAPMPKGTDLVVMQEDVNVEGEQIRLTHPQKLKVGTNVRRRGGDIDKGSQILRAGVRLGPAHIGLLASLGLAEVPVFRRLRVGLLSTGDELCPPGTPLASGQIYDSNRYLLSAILTRLNVEILDYGLIADDPAAIRAAFERAQSECDLILSSGGVSVGEADYTRDILGELGDITFWKIAMKPGKPLAFGRLGSAWFFGLPGNPVSAALTFHQIALPALQRLAGELPATPLCLPAELGATTRKRPGRTDFQRGSLTTREGKLVATPQDEQSSGVLSSMTRADCYIKLGQFAGNQAEGETVEVLPFDRWIL
ncbi:gephyrin-like molybdotransferase Glp [Simiduia agarivorans]|uniref:Molybdopterin molybdenumtransferase n=1 Tax=Simiduia agarivorans (strain DSM 21679 / JCM 13881 / BCRC 17597 / SA1) TaxID=1117647 RepID=K4KPV2_SIMAS|nr:gephyrin-like molybdotransferase Glp [Simiduia agarivorans]AFV00281.1 molybdenum cofactor synthesis domain-containing protein [Simiduia agarivorans SA1 = DSM 21679]